MRLKWIVLILAVLIADLASAHDFVSEPVRQRVIETTALNDRGRSFVRARDFRESWVPWELSEAIVGLFGSDVAASESRGKVYYSNEQSPFRIIEDPFGHYFRVQRKLDSAFVDRNGEVPSATDFAKNAEMTHFRYTPPPDEMTQERFFAERAEVRRRLLEVEGKYSVIANDSHYNVLKEFGRDQARTELFSRLFGRRFASSAEAWTFINKLDWDRVPKFFKYEIVEIARLGHFYSRIEVTDQNRAEIEAMARWGAKTGELRFIVVSIDKRSAGALGPLIETWYDSAFNHRDTLTRKVPSDAEVEIWERIRELARKGSAQRGASISPRRPTCRSLFR